MRVCKNCGNKNPDGARFCKKCGNSLVMQSQQRASGGSGQRNGRPAQQRSGQQNRRPAQQSRGGRKSRRESSNTGLTVVFCLLGALLAVLLIGAGILVAMHLAG